MISQLLELLQLFFWLIIAPFAMGAIPCAWVRKEKRAWGLIFVAGYLVMFSLFELLVVPMVLLQLPFTTAVKWVSIAFILAAAAGTGLLVKTAAEQKSLRGMLENTFGVKLSRPAVSVSEAAMWALFFCLLAFQLYHAYAMVSFDGDDAYFVAQSVTADRGDSMYGYVPYTGFGTKLDTRHALAVLPLWIAFIARQSGVHAAIVSHLVIPFIFVPLTYLCYYFIGKEVFKEHKQAVPVFMIIVGFLQIFGNVSIYTKETFFIMRTWQGKSFFANFVLTAIVFLLLWLTGRAKKGLAEKENPGLWILLFCCNMTAAFSTTMGVFLTALLIGITGLWLSVKNKSWELLAKLALSCIPCIAYTLLYLILN